MRQIGTMTIVVIQTITESMMINEVRHLHGAVIKTENIESTVGTVQIENKQNSISLKSIFQITEEADRRRDRDRYRDRERERDRDRGSSRR